MAEQSLRQSAGDRRLSFETESLVHPKDSNHTEKTVQIDKKKYHWSIIVGALLLTQIGFGSNSIFIKEFAQNYDANPLIFSFCRDVFAFPLLLIIGVLVEGWHYPTLAEARVFAALGLALFGNQFMFILALYFSSPDVASIFQPLIPVWTIILAAVVRVEPLGSWNSPIAWTKILGVLAAAGGGLVMTLGAGGIKVDDGANLFLGEMLLLVNTFSVAAYICIQKMFIYGSGSEGRWKDPLYKRWIDYPILTTAWAYGFAATWIGLSSIYYIAGDRTQWVIAKETIIALVYAVLIQSTMCYALISFTNKYTSGIVVAAFYPVQTLVTFIGSYIFFSETLSTLEWIGAALMLSGLFFVTYANHLKEKRLKARSESKPLIESEKQKRSSSETSFTI